MKVLGQIEQNIGGDGAKIKGALALKEQNLEASVVIAYPVEKIIQPATQLFDSALDKLEKMIPGNWDKPMIDAFKAQYKADLIAALTATPAITEPA